jgi:Phosphate transporter family
MTVLRLGTAESRVLSNLDLTSSPAIGLLIVALLMVIAYEATNGFHDAVNAVASVIYTKSMTPVQAMVWSDVMNFTGVLVGGIAVAYALVELLPPEVLSPPSGAPAISMLIGLFVAALFWNIGTWWFGLPNSSSHCLIWSANWHRKLAMLLCTGAVLSRVCTGHRSGRFLRRSRFLLYWALFCPPLSILFYAEPFGISASTSQQKTIRRYGGCGMILSPPAPA